MTKGWLEGRGAQEMRELQDSKKRSTFIPKIFNYCIVQGELRQRVARGMAWSLGEKGASMLWQAVVGIVVARQLMPEDYGLMAILTVFVTLALVVVDSGFSQALIRSAEPTEEEYTSVFALNLLISLLLYGVALVASPFLARFFGLPSLARVAPVLFLILPINALCVIQQAICARRLRFDTLSKVVFLSNLLGGALAVGMALAGWGVWSLVAQRLAAMALKALMLWCSAGWRPEGGFSLSALRLMAPFSLRLMATDLITTLYNNIAQLFLGKCYTAQLLGYFNQAQKLKELPVAALQQSLQSVTYPALSRIKEGPEHLAESYRQLLVVVATLIFPLMVGMVAVAPDLFMLLLGERWMPTVPYFEILTLTGLFLPLASIAYNLLKVATDGAVIVRLELFKKGVMTLILVISIPLGPKAIAWGMVVMTFVEWAANSLLAARYAPLSKWAFWGALLPAAVLSLLMYGVVKLVALVVDLPVVLDLLLQILSGGLFYLLGLLALRSEALRIGWEVWSRMRRG